MNLNIHSIKNNLFALTARALEGSKVIIASIIVARVFSPDDFGRYSYIIGISSVIAVIAEFRLQSVMMKKILQSPKNSGEIIGSAISANIAFSGIGILIASIYIQLESDKTIIIGTLIYTASFFYKAPRAFRAYFISTENNLTIAKCEIVAAIISLATTLAFIYLKLSLSWIIFARSLDFLTSGILLTTAFKLEVKGKIKLSTKFAEAKSMTFLSAPLVFSGAAMILLQRMDLILVRQILGEHAAGLYSSAATAMSLFSIIPLVISETLAPAIFRNPTPSQTHRIQQNFSDTVVFTGIAMSACMAAATPLFIKFLYGPSYIEAQHAMYILSACPVLIALGAASGQIIVADGNQNQSFIKSIVACMINLLSNIVLIPKMGINGAATSTVIGLLIANFLSHRLIPIYRYLFKIQIRSLLPIHRMRMTYRG
ncbi:oligosaccharide flippase family protein [Pseudomonas nitroreducens]|uniref:Oligosaccharide flippase family protein n=1 Tax=Pseudomonas nitroreducens TaxID=46680 RepID=A0ABS0KHE0_PSENT|nr:oligosaccharide flippase family protein [Pseudomonas nitroreducens]MBG6287502.1 oligosaccharide flippase family protein [Pseudomonas nitroreducens]